MLNFTQKSKGRAKIQVVQNGVVVQETDWIRNLILTQGLDGIATRTWAAAFTHCVGGTGNTPTSDDSGAITASQTTTTVTASSPFFSGSNVNQLIRWDTGEEATITAFTDSTHVTVTPSQSVASGEFTIYRVNQTGLTAEVARTNTYLTGVGNCGTSDSSGTRTMKRTYDFTAEVANVNYAEIGFSHTSSVGNNLFSRIVLPAPVTVLGPSGPNPGQQLRVIYELAVTVSPRVSTPATLSISGWPVAPAVNTEGDYVLLAYGIAGVNTSGAVSGIDGSANDASTSSASCRISIATNTTLGTFGSPPSQLNGTPVGATADSYSAGTFTRTKRITYSVSQANGTDLRSIFLDNSSADNTWQFLFDQAQTKDNAHTLTLVMRWTWNRDLS